MTGQTLRPSPLARLAIFAGDIKINHTVFALPWAILSTVLAAKRSNDGLTLGKVLLILACMVTARTAAMSANRLMDADLDAKNPRTAKRAIPGGLLPASFVAAALIASSGGFILACGGFYLIERNFWPIVLSPLVLAFICAYPLLKRFTQLCHFYLGAALALAPVCAWIAIGGQRSWTPVEMFGAVLAWTAGFDIIYACQDYSSDLVNKVFSIPARYGIAAALWISRLTHVVCLSLLILLGLTTPEFGTFFWIAVVLAAGLLLTEHALVRPNDLSKVGLAFFTVNGIISVLIGTLGVLDVLRR
jgi:4-hydroxybenzoate polyprenyltransferase